MSKNIPIKDEEYKRLKQIETLFFYMLEHTSDFIYFKDKNFKFTYVSQIFADLTRHTNWQDLAGKTDFDVFDFEHASHYRSIDSEVILAIGY